MNKAWQVDKQQVRASFGRAAATYDEATELQREMGNRMLERLDLVRMQPQVILDVGCGTGVVTAELARRYKKAHVLALDLAEPMLKKARERKPWFRHMDFICGDADALPLADGCVDMIFSNAAVQWCENLQATLQEFLRVLKPGGLLMFTTFGPNTLTEMRQSWEAVDGYSHVNRFLDMHDVGDMTLKAGFAEPVIDVEHFTLTYDQVGGVMRDLKLMGAHNVTQGRPRGLMGKTRLRAMQAAYEEFRRDGKLPATWEVVYGHAWAPEMPVKAPNEMPLDGLMRSARR